MLGEPPTADPWIAFVKRPKSCDNCPVTVACLKILYCSRYSLKDRPSKFKKKAKLHIIVRPFAEFPKVTRTASNGRGSSKNGSRTAVNSRNREKTRKKWRVECWCSDFRPNYEADENGQPKRRLPSLKPERKLAVQLRKLVGGIRNCCCTAAETLLSASRRFVSSEL